MHDFSYHEPKTVAEAAAIIRAARDGSLIAGGLSLIAALKQRRARPSDLVDLRHIEELKGIRREANAIVIGAMTRHVDVANSAVVSGAIPELARLVGQMADPAVRNRATLGGSIAHGDPAGDYPPALVALGATIITSTRAIPADDFFTGAFATALREGRNRYRRQLPHPRNSGLREIRQHGVALRHHRSVRRQQRTRCARGGHRRETLRLPHQGNGSSLGQFLQCRCHQTHRNHCAGIERGYPCDARISCPPHRRDGAASGRVGSQGASTKLSTLLGIEPRRILLRCRLFICFFCSRRRPSSSRCARFSSARESGGAGEGDHAKHGGGGL